MGTSPAKTERNQAALGTRLLGIGAVLAIIGVVLILILDGLGDGIGATLLALGAVPGMAGLALLASGAVNRWARKDKPFA